MASLAPAKRRNWVSDSKAAPGIVKTGSYGCSARLLGGTPKAARFLVAFQREILGPHAGSHAGPYSASLPLAAIPLYPIGSIFAIISERANSRIR